MVKKLLLCMVLAVLAASPAVSSESYVSATHQSIADIKDGRADLSNARFRMIGVQINSSSFQEIGTMTLSGGRYSYWDEKAVQTVTGEPHTFSYDEDAFAYWCFFQEADGGLNGVNVSWNFPDDPSMNGSTTLPNFRTTQQQLDSFVPYVEYVYSGDKVSGFMVRLVNPSNVSVPVVQNVNANVSVSFSLADNLGHFHLGVYGWDFGRVLTFNAGETPEGTVMFRDNEHFGEFYGADEVDASEILDVSVSVNLGDSRESYEWLYCTGYLSSTRLWTNHMTEARLVNGRSDYSNARFAALYFNVGIDCVMAEARHFTDQGRVTIPGGNYSLADDNTGEELGVTVPNGTNRTYRLRMNRGIAPGDSYVEYQPIDDSGRNLDFSGNAETSLAGKTITWTFPEEFGFSGNAALSSFKSIAEQLVSGVPYVELVSKDGYITAVNYRIVTASDTSTALTPTYRTDFQLRFDRIVPDTGGDYYYSSWLRNTSSGTWTLEKPQAVSNMDSFTVRIRTYENPDKSILYQWEFYPASTPQQSSSSGSSGGGCTTGFTLTALFLTKKH